MNEVVMRGYQTLLSFLFFIFYLFIYLFFITKQFYKIVGNPLILTSRQLALENH